MNRSSKNKVAAWMLTTECLVEQPLWDWLCKNGLTAIGPGSQDPGLSQAAIAATSGLTPTMLITRVKL